MNCKIHFKYFHTLFLAHSYIFIQLILIFIQVFIELGYFSQFQQLGTKKCVLWLGNTLVILSSLIYTLSCNQNAILIHFFIQLCYLSHSWPNFNIFGIKKYSIELKIHLKYFHALLYTHSHTFMQSEYNFNKIFHMIWLFQSFSTYWVLKIMYSGSKFHW